MADIGDDRVRKPGEAIHWYDGLLLAPAHFQQLCLRQEELLAYQLRAAAPYAWGVRRMEIDQGSLAQNIFVLTALEAILPDGLLLIHEALHGKLDLQLSASQLSFLKQPGNRLKIYLAVAAGDSSDPQGGMTRYTRSLDSAPLGIERIRPAPRLLAETDIKPGSDVVLPLAVLSYQNERLAPQGFLPPLLDIATVPLCERDSLQQLALNLLDRLNGSASRLTTDLARISTDRDLERRLDLRDKLRSVSSALPLLTGILNLTAVSPLMLYQTLSSVAGALYMLRDMNTPAPRHPAYQHTNLDDTFAPLFKMLNDLLRKVERSYDEYPFRLAPFEGSDAFQLVLEAAWQYHWKAQAGAHGAAQTMLVIGLRGLSRDAAVHWLKDTPIASAGSLMQQRALRASGVQRSLIMDDGTLQALQPALEHAAPVATLSLNVDALRSEGTVLFALAVDTALIRAGEALVLDRCSLPRPRDIVLFAAKLAEPGASGAAAP